MAGAAPSGLGAELREIEPIDSSASADPEGCGRSRKTPGTLKLERDGRWPIAVSHRQLIAFYGPEAAGVIRAEGQGFTGPGVSS